MYAALFIPAYVFSSRSMSVSAGTLKSTVKYPANESAIKLLTLFESIVTINSFSVLAQTI